MGHSLFSFLWSTQRWHRSQGDNPRIPMWAPGERFCPCSGLLRLRYWKLASYWGGTSLNPATGRREDDNVQYQGIISTNGRTKAERQRERILTASELESLGFWTQHQTSHWKWVNKFQFLLKWLWNLPGTCYWNSVEQSSTLQWQLSSWI